MIRKILLTLTLISFSLCSNSAGTAMFRWGEIETGTRALGMAGTQVASGNGISSLPYNPANVGFTNKSEVFVSKSAYLVNTSHNTIAYATKISPSDYIGVHLYYFDSGEMDETTELEGETGQKFKYLGLILRTAYAKQLTDRLKLGVAVKLIRENTTSADLSSSALALDIGSNFNTGLFGGTVLGMSVTNFGPDSRYVGSGLDVPSDDENIPSDTQNTTEYFPIPLTFRVGIMNNIIGEGSDAILKNSSGHKLSVAADFINPLDYDTLASIATEYSWKDLVFVRAGQHFGHDTAGFAAGFGVSYRNIALDFAYADYDILEHTWQVGLGYKF